MQRTKRPSSRMRLITDPVKAAASAQLRYVNDDEPGIRREANGEGFRYRHPDGKPVRDRATLERIASLAIPPAYTDVWICADADGHLQATGRDARGRKQYRYHPRWRETRDHTKFERMLLFGEALPKLRQQIEHDLARHGLPREKVVAAVVALLGATFIRVGNREYARDNDSFGLTTMLDEHVRVTGATIHFKFRGKSGKDHSIDWQDKRLARIVKRCQALPGQALFQYVDERGATHAITSADVNAYLHEKTGQPFTAKDFRTWGGTVYALLTLVERDPTSEAVACKAAINAMFKQVAAHLGNTVAVCRKYYVHPAIVTMYEDGTLHEWIAPHADALKSDDTRLTACEQAVMTMLRESAAG